MAGTTCDGLGSMLKTTQFIPSGVSRWSRYNTNIRTWGGWKTAELWPEDDGACYAICGATAYINSGGTIWVQLDIANTFILDGIVVRGWSWEPPPGRIPFIRYPDMAGIGIYLPWLGGSGNPQVAIHGYKYREESL